MAQTVNNFIAVKINELLSDPAFDASRILISADAGNGDMYKIDYQALIDLVVTTLGGQSVAYKGSAVPATDPGTPTTPEYYIATEVGTYTNFLDSTSTAIVVNAGEDFVILSYDGGAWAKQIVNIDLSNYATKSEALTKSKYTSQSNNLVTPENFKAGYYRSTDGLFIGTINSLCTDLIDISTTETNISISGYGENLHATSRRFTFFDDSNNFILSINGPENVSIPSNATKVAINIQSEINIGQTPSNTRFNDTLMLNYGEKPLGFEHPGKIIPNDFIKGLSDRIASNSSIQKTSQFVDSVSFKTENLFKSSYALGTLIYTTGNDAGHQDNWLGTDFIKIDGSKNKISASGYSGFSNNLAIAFYDSSQTFISGVVASGLSSYTATIPSSAEYVRCTIANVVGIGNSPQNNDYVDRFMLNYGEAKEWQPQAGNGFINRDRIYGLKSFPAMFVDLRPCTTPYSSSLIQADVAYIYEQLHNNYYIKHTLIYEHLDFSDYVSGDFHGGKVVRYAGSKISVYNKENNTFEDTTTQIVIGAESEFVLNISGWTGGYHGNEILDKVYFLIDGKVYNAGGGVSFSATGLIACKSFSYIQHSSLKLDADQSTLADRLKVSRFVDGGYEVRTKFKAQQTQTALIYFGICCISKDFTSLVSDSGTIVIPMGDDSKPVDGDSFSKKYFYCSDDYSASIESSILYGEALERDASVRIWDRSTDTKYYRQLQSHQINNGDVFECLQKFTVKKKS